MEAVGGFLYTTIIFFIVISVIVFVHELGHFSFARRFGIGVREFAIGFGKKLFSRKRGDTEYSIRMIPLGGFVDLLGMDPSEDEEAGEDGFRAKAGYAKFLVLLAGPAMNFVLAFLLFVIIYSAMGTLQYKYSELPVAGIVGVDGPAHIAGIQAGDMITAIDGSEIQKYSDIPEALSSLETNRAEVSFKRLDGEELSVDVTFPEISDENKADSGDTEKKYLLQIGPDFEPVIEVVPNHPASKAGLKTGDKVLSINGIKSRTWGDLPATIRANPKDELLEMEVLRDGKTLSFSIEPEWTDDENGGYSKIGITPAIAVGPSLPIHKAVKQAALETYFTTAAMIKSIWGLISGEISSGELSGPVGIAGIIGERARQGLATLFRITAFLSINIGLINLIPFPALDGSRMLIILVEMISRRRVSAKIEEKIHLVGMVLLITLMVWVTGKDIINLFKA